METQHLSNTIAMLRAKGTITPDDLERMKVEWKTQTKDGELDTLLSLKGCTISPILQVMEAELLSRYQGRGVNPLKIFID